MHYFIYPTKDTWISSGSRIDSTGVTEHDQNYGQDQILELKKEFYNSDFNYSTRVLLSFKGDEFVNISKSISDGTIVGPKFYLRLYEGDGTSELSSEYKLLAQPLSQSWDEGTGKWEDNPKTTNGCSWKFRNNKKGHVATSWSNAAGATSYGGAVHSVSHSTQTFSYSSPDVEMDITDMAKSWLSGSLPGGFENHGLLLRFSGSQETSSLSDEPNAENGFATFDNVHANLKFFSRNTHTIYPPKLEVRWDDHIAASGSNTGSLNQLSMSGADNFLYIKNLKQFYREDSKSRFYVGARKRYIQKTFTTSLQTVTGSYIPEGSGSYSILDSTTGEVIVPFSSYTSMSCNSTQGMYFDQWMNTFQPNRTYKILLKLNYDDGRRETFDDDWTFTIKNR
jgi:hypothetical protein